MEPVTEADPAGSDRETPSVEKKPDCEGHGASAAAKHTPHGKNKSYYETLSQIAVPLRVTECTAGGCYAHPSVYTYMVCFPQEAKFQRINCDNNAFRTRVAGHIIHIAA